MRKTCLGLGTIATAIAWTMWTAMAFVTSSILVWAQRMPAGCATVLVRFTSAAVLTDLKAIAIASAASPTPLGCVEVSVLPMPTAMAFVTNVVEPDGHWLEVDVVAVHDTGVLAGMTTYRVSLVCPDSTDYLYQVAAFEDSPLALNATFGLWYNHPANDDWRPLGILADSVAVHPELAYDSFLTIGVEDGTADVAPAGYFGWNLAAAEFLPSGGQNVMVSETGYMLLSTPQDETDFDHPGFAGGDHRVLVMQMTTPGDISGQMNIRSSPQAMFDGSPLDLVLSYSSASVCYNLDPCVGDYDECGVCNGQGRSTSAVATTSPPAIAIATATSPMSSACAGATARWIRTWTGCATRKRLLGCDDADACNFDALATENDGSCTYPELFYDCDGVCFNDADLDGVCDELEVLGCTDSTACNFIDMATESDSTCTFPGDTCDDGDPLTLVDVLNAACECVDSASVDGIFNAVWPTLTVHPNPASDRLTVVLPDPFNRANVQLTSCPCRAKPSPPRAPPPRARSNGTSGICRPARISCTSPAHSARPRAASC